jgi:hypothetical protein
MTKSIDRNQWLNVTSESRDRIYLFFFNFALGRNRTRDPRVPGPKWTPLGYILPIFCIEIMHSVNCLCSTLRVDTRYISNPALEFLTWMSICHSYSCHFDSCCDRMTKLSKYVTTMFQITVVAVISSSLL